MGFVDIESVVNMFKLNQDSVLAAIEAGHIPVIRDKGRTLVPDWFIEPLLIIGGAGRDGKRPGPPRARAVLGVGHPARFF